MLVLASTAAALAQPDVRARIEERAARASARLEALHREADRLAGEARTLLNELRRHEVDRMIASAELSRATEDAEQATADLAELDLQLAALEEAEQAQRPLLEQRLVDLYKLGDARYLRLLLSASDARHAGHAARTVAMLARTDRQRVDERHRQLEALRTTREQLAVREQQLIALRAEAERARVAADDAVREHNALLRRIDQRRDLTAQLAGELQIARDNLQITVQAMSRGAAAAEVALPLAPFQGDLDWPVAGTLRRRFSRDTSDSPTAAGIEIAAPEGTSVQTVHGGTVAFANSFAGFGNLVIVEHDSRNFTLYGHLMDIMVTRGARVESGDAVGSVGLTPSGQAGLYFELRIDSRPVDPLEWLRTR